MIANNQLNGEATWFWYTTFFHRGAKLYADLHLALQPLLVLEMNAWMNLFGRKLLSAEIPSVLHLVFLCVGLLLLLRESDWPDWQKANVLAGAFVVWSTGSSYRFDDYHVTTESFILYSLVLLLLVRGGCAEGDNLCWPALGILCGLTATSGRWMTWCGVAGVNRPVPAGAGVRTRKLLILSVFVAMAVLMAALILKLTGRLVPGLCFEQLCEGGWQQRRDGEFSG